MDSITGTCSLLPVRRQAGSAFIVAVVILAFLATLSAVVVSAITARLPVSSQQTSYLQAHAAAEAGIDLTLDYLNANPQSSNTTAAWPGWKQPDGVTAASGSHLALRFGNATGSGTMIVASNLYAAPANLSGTTNISGISNPIYSGTALTSSSGTLAYVNRSIRAIYPTVSGAAGSPWYIIRSMGTAPVPGPKRTPRDKPDRELRKISLTRIRPGLLSEIATSPTNSLPSSLNASIPLPGWWRQTPVQPTVSRVIQVIAQPKISYLFGYAMFTQQSMVWGNNGKFYTDSWNSGEATNGDYPAGAFNDSNPKARHHRGNVASNDPTAGSIDLNGGTVNGTVQTPAGTNGLATTNKGAIDGSLVPPEDVNAAVVSASTPMPSPKTVPSGFPISATTKIPSALPVSGPTPDAATKYHLSSTSTSVGSLTFSGSGFVQVWIDGKNWTPSKVTVPKGVHASIYVAGNIDFGNGKINDPADAATSGLPGDLIVYGISTATYPRPTIATNGNPVISAAIFAPAYDFSVSGGGNGTFYGAITVYSFGNNGGGNLELHYDEALQKAGDPVITGYNAAGYYEDTRL